MTLRIHFLLDIIAHIRYTLSASRKRTFYVKGILSRRLEAKPFLTSNVEQNPFFVGGKLCKKNNSGGYVLKGGV